RARGAGQLEPDRAAARLDREPEAQERAAPALEVDERREERKPLRLGGEAERDAVGEPSRGLLSAPDLAQHAGAARGELRLGQAAGDGQLGHGPPYPPKRNVEPVGLPTSSCPIR